MKVAKVKRTINGRAIPKAQHEDVHFTLNEDRHVTLLTNEYDEIAEGYYHNVLTSANFAGFHLRIEVMVKARDLSNDPGDERPAEFNFETWYVAFYPVGQDKP